MNRRVETALVTSEETGKQKLKWNQKSKINGADEFMP